MRVYLIEDESLIRELVSTFISALPDIEIVGQAADGTVAMHEIEQLQPDLVLTDIRLPEVNGMEILFLLKRRHPEMKVIVFSGSITTDKVRLAYEGGADGFVEKGSGLDDFENAVRCVREGKRYFSRQTCQLLVQLEGPEVLKHITGFAS